MAHIQIRISDEEKEAVQSAFENMGMTMSGGIKMFLRQVAAHKKMPFEISEVPRKPKKVPIKKTVNKPMAKAAPPKVVAEKAVKVQSKERKPSENFKKWNLFDKQQIG